MCSDYDKTRTLGSLTPQEPLAVYLKDLYNAATGRFKRTELVLEELLSCFPRQLSVEDMEEQIERKTPSDRQADVQHAVYLFQEEADAAVNLDAYDMTGER